MVTGRVEELPAPGVKECIPKLSQKQEVRNPAAQRRPEAAAPKETPATSGCTEPPLSIQPAPGPERAGMLLVARKQRQPMLQGGCRNPGSVVANGNPPGSELTLDPARLPGCFSIRQNTLIGAKESVGSITPLVGIAFKELHVSNNAVCQDAPLQSGQKHLRRSARAAFPLPLKIDQETGVQQHHSGHFEDVRTVRPRLARSSIRSRTSSSK